MIEVVRAGVLASVQDLGRTGYRRFGACTSGALGPLSLYVGNRLAGNRGGAADIELTLDNATLRFHASSLTVLTGADYHATLDGVSVHVWRAIPVQRRQVLTLHMAQGGVRAYLCVADGIGASEAMGSRNTDLRAGFGGFEERPLKDGDRLPVLPVDTTHIPDISSDTVAVKAARWAFDRAQEDTPVMHVLPGLEYDDLVADA